MPSNHDGAEDLAGQAHWDKRSDKVRPTLPSRLNASVADLLDLVGDHLSPGKRVLEVGCAPGKFLLWCALAKGADACGVEYAPESYKTTHQLFEDAGAKADIRLEDFMQTSFDPRSFDVVFSFGVIEHFTDPRPMVTKHAEMLKPGGVAIIVVPNYGPGLYGWLQQRLDRANYDLHNVSIMTESGLLDLAPNRSTARVFYYGRFTPWILSLGKLPFGNLMSLSVNAAALIQPMQIRSLCPWIVLELRG